VLAPAPSAAQAFTNVAVLETSFRAGMVVCGITGAASAAFERKLFEPIIYFSVDRTIYLWYGLPSDGSSVLEGKILRAGGTDDAAPWKPEQRQERSAGEAGRCC
jgi:hypothetical protein